MTMIRYVMIAAVAALSVFSTANAASAVEAASTTSLNVRSGPGTSFGVVDTLFAGEIVEITECEANGWCYIEHTGPNGWVSSGYLTAAPESGGTPADPDCSLSFTIGPDGPTMSIVCGGGAPAPATPAPEPAPVTDQACFYTDANYGGTYFCYGVGTLNALNTTFNDRISSVKLEGNAKARICANNNLDGFCREVTTNTNALGFLINDKTSSLVVYTGTSPSTSPTLIPMPIPLTPLIVTPVTHSTGPIELKQTFSANLDNGAVSGAGVDIWYQAVTATSKFITPRNGAFLALGDGSNRGYAGCKVAAFSGSQIPLGAMPVGTYVCVKTDQGRISQFRLNGFTGTTMNIGYTTWAN